MTEPASTHGLSCPNCGGMVPIPEGQVIVCCPFCDLRSMVRGERGLPRYQVSQQIDREQAIQALRRFFKGRSAIASDVASKSTLVETFVAFIPFWTGWARVLSWVFGQKRVGSGDNKRYEPREVKVVQDLTWNGVACDVGEFGVQSVPLISQALQPFAADELHNTGMVFEPVGSASDARSQAQAEYHAIIGQKANLDRLGQTFIRFIRQRMGLVYYPLWVLRYLYRGRAFQVVVDAHTGQVLYGKAPGNTLYRAAMLVAGMAAGAFLSIDGSALMTTLAFRTDSDDSMGLLGVALALFVAGLGLIAAAYRAFRYGEQYEYRLGSQRTEAKGKSSGGSLPRPSDLISQVTDVEKWLDRLS